MVKYSVINKKNTAEQYDFEAQGATDARHWIINHLDQSKQWALFFIK